MPTARIVERRDFTRYPAGMSIAGVVVYIGYFYRGRTSSALTFGRQCSLAITTEETRTSTFIDNSIYTSYPNIRLILSGVDFSTEDILN